MSIRVLAVALFLFAGTAAAVEPVKFDLTKFKVKAAKDDLGGLNESDSKLFLYTAGTMTCETEVPADGTYTLLLEMSCDEAKGVKAQVKITLGDDAVKGKFDLTTADTKEYKFEVKAKKGKLKLVVEYLNDEFKEGEFDRNFYLHAARLEEKK